MRTTSLTYPLLTLVTCVAIGCGGSDSATGGGFQNGQQCNDAGVCSGTGFGGFGNFAGTSNTNGTGNGTSIGGTGTGVGGNAAKPPGPNCGDGTVNPDEQCDKGNLAGATCSTATMGAMPSGALACAANCTFDLAGCHTNGNPGGTGGTTGTGGNTGTGGRIGTGGRGGP